MLAGVGLIIGGTAVAITGAIWTPFNVPEGLDTINQGIILINTGVPVLRIPRQ